MAMINHNIELDVVPGGVLPVIHVNQYDSSVCLNFHLYAREGKLQAFSSLTSAKIRGTKADGNGISVPVTSYSYSARTVSVNLTQQMTACAGRNVYELVIYYTSGAGEELCTANFILYVERAALDKDTLISGSEIRELVNVVDRTDELLAAAATVDTGVETIQALTRRAETASSSAEGSAASAAAAAEEATSALTEIGRKKTEAVDAITIARDNVTEEAADALTEIRRKKTEGVDAVNAAGESAKEEMASELTKFKNAAQSATETLENESEEYLAQISTQYRKVMNKGDQILQLTTSAEEIASDALSRANNARNGVASLENRMSEFETALENVTIDPDDLGLWQDEDTFYVYPTYRGVVSENGIPLASSGGGGGGGGDVISAVLTVENTSGWLSKTISSGSSCPVSFTWSSVEDGIPTGTGTIRITVNEIVKATMEIAQGNVSFDLKPYLSTGSNKVKIRISDIYDQGRTTTFNITSIALSISSTFDTSVQYSGAFGFPYTPLGAVEKTMHFILDGVEIGTETTSVSGRRLTYTIPAQTHGGHSLRAYFTAVINEEIVQSNELYFEFVYVEPLNDDVIVTSSFHTDTVQQYASLAIPFRVYDPTVLTAEVKIYVNDLLVSTQTVDRTEQSYTYRANTAGNLKIDIKSGGTTKTLTTRVEESSVDIEAETRDLMLHLTSEGHSNNDDHPEEWKDEGHHINAVLTGFNFASDGWQKDEDNIVCLRVSGKARVAIPYNIFASDIRQSGLTVEVEFATRNVSDYGATILSCMSGGRGITVTPQQVTMKSDQTELTMQYKEGEHIRVAFTVDKRSEDRLVKSYINGKIARVLLYPSDDDFQQVTPVGISIGSSGCTVDIYRIRVYSNNLTMQQVLENWIADTRDGGLLLERYARNRVYDAYGRVVIAQLPSNLPYFVFEAEELPQYKKDKKIISGYYTDPMHPSKSFSFTGMQIDVQGTSSAPYYRKNYDLQFKNGFEMSSESHADKYKLRETSVPTARFVVKADVASSESANNTQLVRLYNDICPYKTDEMLADPRVRWGIDGFPIVVFWHDTATDETKFLGKYNFNFPKRFPEGYGYSGDDESWEWQNNTSDRMLFKSDDFDSMYTDPETMEEYPAWKNDFEARFPEDTWEDTDNLREWIGWVVSTDRDQATGEPLPSPVTYGGVSYTNDTAEYRLAKFSAELGDYAEEDSLIFYYIFTELFLMVDSRAKNLFMGFHGSACEARGAMERKVVAEPYDMDTAAGTNNEGTLTYGYSLEDTDTVDGEDVFNGQHSVLWCNLRDTRRAAIVQMYQRLRSSGGLNLANVEQRFSEAQGMWPEAVWNEDARSKYLDPLTNPDTGKEPTDFYLPMCQGSKEQQRKWWLTNRFAYMDSKWNAGDALVQVIQLRGYAKADITVTPYIDLYPTVKYGSYLVQARGKAGVPSTLVCPMDSVNDTEIYVYSARNIASIGDISGLKVGIADFSYAVNIQAVKIGDASAEYDNPNLKTLSFGSNVLLKTIDVRNCSKLGTGEQKSIDISNCAVIEEVYFDGTAIQGLSLPNGGVLRVLHLPATLSNLTVLNQRNIEEFVLPSYENIKTLRIENSNLDMKAMLRAVPANTRVRLIGISWEAEDAAEIEGLLDRLDLMQGLDETGGNMDKAQVSGTIHTTALTGEQIAAYNARYPYLTVTADYVSSVLTYATWDGSSVLKQVTCYNGVPQDTAPSGPTRSSTAQYSYTFVGWSKRQDATAADADAAVDVLADRTIYAAYSRTVRTYSVYFVKASADGGGTLQTLTGIPYGRVVTAASSYTGATPTTSQGSAEDYPFEGWNPASATVQGNTTFTAKFGSPVEVAEISDSWDIIITNIDNGTYKTKYKLGNYKPLDLGDEGIINMQIVAIDGDALADGSGYAPLTFLGMEQLTTTHVMQGNGKWPNSTMRSYLLNTIMPLIPSPVSARIRKVSKTYRDYALGTMTSEDTLWIPSGRELYGPYTYYEDSGVSYTTVYKDTDARKKKRGTKTGTYYWLRTGAHAAAYYAVNGSGAIVSNDQSYATGVCIGFCLGLEPETISDSWETILANPNYAADYSVGDTKYLDLGTEGRHLMEIVAFDTDDRADGTGKAGITWISKTLLNTVHRMNPSYSEGVEGTGTLGGWEKSEMRAYLKETIKPMIPAEVRNAIVPVTKVSKAFNVSKSAFQQTTADDVWIPGHKEIFSSTTYDESGPSYSSKFASATDRIKKRSSSVTSWWQRTADRVSGFRTVYISGDGSYSGSTITNGVALGFCTN